jgi:Xaa-Pro aminopeptidase
MAGQEDAPLLQRSRSYQGSSHWSKLKKSTMVSPYFLFYSLLLTNKKKLFRAIFVLAVLTALAGGTWFIQRYLNSRQGLDRDLKPLLGYCNHIEPIPPTEYTKRHEKLAATLKDENADALVMEGGATMLYYANIEWSLTERAFLVVLKRDDSEPTGISTTIVTPAFEATRAQKALGEANLPADIKPTMVEWLEYKSPFEAVQKVLTNTSHVIVEQNARLFVYDGIAKLGQQKVTMAPRSIRMLRMIKSQAELKIMKCVNTLTELTIRAVRPHVKVGMSEQQIGDMMENSLQKVGLIKTWVLALVDENAALPHGEAGTKKTTKHSTVLIDTGGELLGYQSDTTRTFFMGKRGYNETIEDAWYLVRRAQENVLNQTGHGMNCAQVDLTARHVIEKGGYGRYFTHRLGHGIGEEMHEEPYMNQGNTEQVLAPGMTFSVE